uniref:Transposase n=1 Tax=Panagrellus redivivus TaxID=6233 RepID=A0A7E4ZWE4_PANRE
MSDKPAPKRLTRMPYLVKARPVFNQNAFSAIVCESFVNPVFLKVNVDGEVVRLCPERGHSLDVHLDCYHCWLVCKLQRILSFQKCHHSD